MIQNQYLDRPAAHDPIERAAASAKIADPGPQMALNRRCDDS
jgi:hypothetical protein